MYEIEGRIYEQHGEYKGRLEIWVVEPGSKQLLVDEYVERLVPLASSPSEHVNTLLLLRVLCTRIAARIDMNLF